MANIEGLITITSTVDIVVVDHKNTAQASRILSTQSQAPQAAGSKRQAPASFFCFAYASKHVRTADRNCCFHWDLTQAQTFNIRWIWIGIMENHLVSHLLLHWQLVHNYLTVKEPAKAPGSRIRSVCLEICLSRRTLVTGCNDLERVRLIGLSSQFLL